MDNMQSEIIKSFISPGGNPPIDRFDDSASMNKQGRLMVLITALTFGGAETQAVRLAEEFKDLGWEVCIVSLLDPVAFVSRVHKRGIEVHSLGLRRGIPDPRAIFRLRKLIDAFRPTIVHSHMFHANLLGRVARLFCKIPKLVCTVHNLKETPERGGLTWRELVLYRATDHLADKTTIICNAAFKLHKRKGVVAAGRLEMIPNGVDTQMFSNSDKQKEAARRQLDLGTDFVWLAVGRMVKQKDYGSLLDALEQLGTSEFTLLILGGGPLEPKLRARRDQSFFKDRVHFCGQHENPLSFYQAADGFVMSSEFEGLSVALLEAASIGLPSVVTDVGGNGDIVRDGESGFLVPPKNPAQLAAAMRKLMDISEDRRQSFSKAARQHAHESFRFPVIMEKWLNLFSDLTEVPSLNGRKKVAPKTELAMGNGLVHAHLRSSGAADQFPTPLGSTSETPKLLMDQR
jgi:glycosyltransferase involved in cell wall biosynthesis